MVRVGQGLSLLRGAWVGAWVKNCVEFIVVFFSGFSRLCHGLIAVLEGVRARVLGCSFQGAALNPRFAVDCFVDSVGSLGAFDWIR